MLNFILAMMKLQISKWDELVLTEMHKAHCPTEKACFESCFPVHKHAEFCLASKTRPSVSVSSEYESLRNAVSEDRWHRGLEQICPKPK